jgi:hypothetical protein
VNIKLHRLKNPWEEDWDGDKILYYMHYLSIQPKQI